MVFRRRKTMLDRVPDRALVAEASARSLVVLPPAAARAVVLAMTRQTERVAELERLLAKSQDVAFAAAEARLRAAAEVSRLSAIAALGDLGFDRREVEAWCRAAYGPGEAK